MSLLRCSVLLATIIVVLASADLTALDTGASGSSLMQDFKVELQPLNVERRSEKGSKAYQMSGQIRFKVVGTNQALDPIKTIVVDRYHQNRPELFKGTAPIPYKPDIAKILNSKDAEPVFIRVGSFLILEPGVPTELETLDLSDWYGELEPGSYRITNKHRFKVQGPWSEKSVELFFDIVPKK